MQGRGGGGGGGEVLKDRGHWRKKKVWLGQRDSWIGWFMVDGCASTATEGLGASTRWCGSVRFVGAHWPDGTSTMAQMARPFHE